MVDMIASMEPTRSEIIRGVPVHCALQGCGQAIRGRLGRRKLYKLSRATRRIDEFWSHSWHASGWMKYVTACYLNTAAIAAAFGMAGALLGFVLRATGALPSIVSNSFTDSQWSVLIGVTFYCLSLTFWRVRRLVFLDLLCIDQDDESLKGEAMISMGAILKSSASMLVLWDASWVQRLGSLLRTLTLLGVKVIAFRLIHFCGEWSAKEILVCFRAGLVSSQPKTPSNSKPETEHSTKPHGTGILRRGGWPGCFTSCIARLVTGTRK